MPTIALTVATRLSAALNSQGTRQFGLGRRRDRSHKRASPTISLAGSRLFWGVFSAQLPSPWILKAMERPTPAHVLCKGPNATIGHHGVAGALVPIPLLTTIAALAEPWTAVGHRGVDL